MDVVTLLYGYGSGSWILGLEWILGRRPVSTQLYVYTPVGCRSVSLQIMPEMFLLCLKVYPLCSHYARYFQGPIIPNIMLA